MMASDRTDLTSSGVISGSGLAMAKMIGLGAMEATISLVIAPLADRPRTTSAPTLAPAPGGRGGAGAGGALPLVHAVFAALIDDAVPIADDGVLGLDPGGLHQGDRGQAGRARARQNHLDLVQPFSGDVAGVDQAGGRDDGRGVLVVMEDGD